MIAVPQKFSIELKDVTGQDVAGIDTRGIANILKTCDDLIWALSKPTINAVDDLRSFREIRSGLNVLGLMQMERHLLNALKGVDPQEYVNLNPKISSMNIMDENGATIRYDKTK